MLAHSVVAAVSDRRRRSEIDATIRARRERRYGQCDQELMSSCIVTPFGVREQLVTKAKRQSGTEEFGEASRARKESSYVLRLFVAGATPRSAIAIRNIKTICEEYLKRRYELEVIDTYQQPTLAEEEKIRAALTPIKKLPLTLRLFLGDRSSTGKVIVGLALPPAPKE